MEFPAYSGVYFNTIQQAMPGNCAADVHAAISYADQILSCGSAAEVSLLRRAIYLMNNADSPSSEMDSSAASDDLSYWDLARMLAYPFTDGPVLFQYVGHQESLGGLCDALEK